MQNMWNNNRNDCAFWLSCIYCVATTKFVAEQIYIRYMDTCLLLTISYAYTCNAKMCKHRTQCERTTWNGSSKSHLIYCLLFTKSYNLVIVRKLYFTHTRNVSLWLCLTCVLTRVHVIFLQCGDNESVMGTLGECEWVH